MSLKHEGDPDQHMLVVRRVTAAKQPDDFEASEVGGVKRSIAQAPSGNPSPAPTLTPRTHDTTDQSGAKRFPPTAPNLTKSVPLWPTRPIGCVRFECRAAYKADHYEAKR